MKLFTKIVNGLKVDLQLNEEPKMPTFGELDEYNFTKKEIERANRGYARCAQQK